MTTHLLSDDCSYRFERPRYRLCHAFWAQLQHAVIGPSVTTAGSYEGDVSVLARLYVARMSFNETHERAAIFVVMPFDKAFDDIYAVIRQALTEMGLRAIRADEIPGSQLSIENVYNAIEQAGLIIAVTSQSNANVLYEVGYADHLGKETILLTDAPGRLPFDVRDKNHLIYDATKLSELAAELKRW